MRSTVARIARITGIGAVVALAIGIVRSVMPKSKPATTGQANWPPLADEQQPAERSGPVTFTHTPEPEATEAGDGAEATEAETSAGETADDAADDRTPEQAWVEPDPEGSCPISHPIKANAQSKIFHVPGGQSYDRTKAERCYSEAADAEADGFRQAKR